MATILLVNDERVVRTLLAVALRRLHHDVIEAGSGRRALNAATETRAVDLLVSELSLPRMSALDLAAELTGEHQLMRALFLSRSPHPNRLEERARASGYTVLREPFTVPDLLVSVADLLDTPADVRKPAARSAGPSQADATINNNTGSVG